MPRITMASGRGHVFLLTFPFIEPGVVADLSRLQEPYRSCEKAEDRAKAGASAPGS